MVHLAVLDLVDLLDLVVSVENKDLRDNLVPLAEMGRMELVEHLVGTYFSLHLLSTSK